MTDRLKAHCVWDVQEWGDNWDIKGLVHYQRNVIPNPYHFLLFIFGKQNELFTAVICSSGCFSYSKNVHFYHRDYPWSTCKVIREESYKVCYFSSTGTVKQNTASNVFLQYAHMCCISIFDCCAQNVAVSHKGHGIPKNTALKQLQLLKKFFAFAIKKECPLHSPAYHVLCEWPS